MIKILLLWLIVNALGFPAWVSYVLAGLFFIKSMHYLLTNFDVEW